MTRWNPGARYAHQVLEDFVFELRTAYCRICPPGSQESANAVMAKAYDRPSQKTPARWCGGTQSTTAIVYLMDKDGRLVSGSM